MQSPECPHRQTTCMRGGSEHCWAGTARTGNCSEDQGDWPGRPGWFLCCLNLAQLLQVCPLFELFNFRGNHLAFLSLNFFPCYLRSKTGKCVRSYSPKYSGSLIWLYNFINILGHSLVSEYGLPSTCNLPWGCSLLFSQCIFWVLPSNLIRNL